MANADVRMFMEDLKKIIHGNHHPLINNDPLILSKRPQFQLLYQELDSIIQTLSNIHHLKYLKKRFNDVVVEAQVSFDLYLFAIHIKNKNLSHRLSRRLFHRLSRGSAVFTTHLDLTNLMRFIRYMVFLMTYHIDKMKMGSSPRIDSLKTHSAGTSTSNTRNRFGTRKLLEEIVVGLDRDAQIIREKLAEDSKQLSNVAIVGMGGLGKTTLAAKLFNDPFIKYHFHIRAWATVSQSYERRDLLIQILTSIGVQEDLGKHHDSKLREKLHKKLMGRRYLIVIDDIWSIEAWDDLKLFFPHDNVGSRILLTSRQNEVALNVKPHSFVYSLPCLTEEESFELLKQKVFHGGQCPEWLVEPGRKIARKCHGLPLSVVVMAGILAEKPMNKDFWENIACTVSSYIVSDKKGCLETLALSYHHLPDHLRECFLYLGGFPEDFRINVKRVIRLWVAEGFIEEAGNRSLEDIAKAYLMDLTNRNLVIVAKRNAIGEMKVCRLHDLVRELCVQKAKEEELFLKIDSPISSSQLLEGITGEQHRIFTNQNVNNLDIPSCPVETTRSLLCFHKDICSVKFIAYSFVLLRVLDLQECRLDDFPQVLELLHQLRYLAIWCPSQFPTSICKLWNLQTLILIRDYFRHIQLPRNITHMVNLRHLWSNAWLYLPHIDKPMNLRSISKVMLEDGVDNFQKCFPNIKKLELDCGIHFLKCSKYLELLPYLENLKLLGPALRWDHIAFPATLKKLSLIKCDLPWSHMSYIQLLPNLEVLKLDCNVVTIGRRWDACEQQFRQLKLLTLRHSNIKQWDASSRSFPCLKQLSVSDCEDLEEIPLEIGEITTLQLIEIDRCSNSVVESVKKIQQEQHDVGNYELNITVNRKDSSFYSSQQ